MDDRRTDRVRRIKDIAARKANEAYAEAIQNAFKEEGLSLIRDLHGTGHVHTAILFDGTEAVAVRCQWDFTSSPEVLTAAMEQAKKEGVA